MVDAFLLREDTDWRAKIARAREHVAELRRVTDEYRAAEPFEISPEPTATPGQTAYRLTVHEPIPDVIPLIVGDVLHNARSALDTALFSAIERERDEPMSDKQMQACQFPIRPDPASFDGFIDGDRVRRALYSADIRRGLRWAQPFYWTEAGKKLNPPPEFDVSYEQAATFSSLLELNRLSNIDKHRRLTTTAFYPGVVSWVTDGDGPDYRCELGDGTWADGSVVMYVIGPPDAGPVNLDHPLVISLPDARRDNHIAFSDSDDVTEVARSWIEAAVSAVTVFTHGLAHTPPSDG